MEGAIDVLQICLGIAVICIVALTACAMLFTHVERMVCLNHGCPLCVDCICKWRYRKRVSIGEIPAGCPRVKEMELKAREKIDDWRKGHDKGSAR